MKTCLVVDDSSVIRKVAKRILEGLDFHIFEAEDGAKALAICKLLTKAFHTDLLALMARRHDRAPVSAGPTAAERLTR